MSYIRSYFDELDNKIKYLDELYETGHGDEAIISMLHTCLKRIVVAAQQKSLSTEKFFGHDYK